MKWLKSFPDSWLALAFHTLERVLRRAPVSRMAQRAHAAIFWELTVRQIERDERRDAARAFRVNAPGGVS